MRFALLPHVLVLSLGAAALSWPLREVALHFEAMDDPGVRADLQLRQAFTEERLATEMKAALDAGDRDLAESFVELATAQGLTPPAAELTRLRALQAENPVLGAARDFSSGFAHGEMGNGMAVTGALTADLSGYGDLRDLLGEGRKWLNGEAADPLVLGLSAAGLAITGATVATLGAAMPARGGLSLAKGLQKAGRLSRPLAATLTRTASGALDRQALEASLTALRRFELGAARKAGANVLRPASVASLRAVGADVGAVAKTAGVRGAQDVLSVAGGATEVRAAARLAAQKGVKTRAILRVLGRGVLIAGSISLTLFSWAITLLLWFFGAASLARRTGERIGRALWRRPTRPLSADPTSSRSVACAK